MGQTCAWLKLEQGFTKRVHNPALNGHRGADHPGTGGGHDRLIVNGLWLVVLAPADATLSRRGRDVGFCFNRKEAKDHGEGGVLVGHAPQDGERVLIVEDVTTAGTSIRETVPILRAAAAVELAGLVVSVDRQERGQGERAALAEVGEEFGMPTFAIVTLDEIVEHLAGREVDGCVVLGDADLARIEAYRAEYGAR